MGWQNKLSYVFLIFLYRNEEKNSKKYFFGIYIAYFLDIGIGL